MPDLPRAPGPADLRGVSRPPLLRLARAGALAAVCVIGAAPPAHAGQRDPRQLVLARSDLAAGARPVARSTGAGAAVSSLLVDAAGKALVRASRHYPAAYHLPGRDVASAAFVFRSEPVARAAFASLTRSLPAVYRRLRLPRLGDAQITAFVVADAYEHRFVVRRGSVVWQLDVLDWSAAPRARLTAAAVALAHRQEARVG
jgi:hypothetical protein